jgi:hypothetical protein
MKKILFVLFLFISTTIHAEWCKGTVTYLNGKVRTGYVKLFTNVETKIIYYKPTLKAKKERIKSTMLREVEMKLQNGNSIHAMYLKTANIVNKTGKLRTSKNKAWLGVYYQGDFNVVGFYSGSWRTTDYYINWPGKDVATLASMVAGNNSFVVGKKKFIRLTSTTIFKGKCDAMIEALENETFVPVKIEDVIEFYEKNCATTRTQL